MGGAPDGNGSYPQSPQLPPSRPSGGRADRRTVGSLASVVYGFRGNGLQTLWSGDLGQGPGAIAWLVGDGDGDGKAEIVQQWNNDGSLGTIVYEWNGSAIVQLWGSRDLDQGSGALAWLIADLDGRGKADVIQEWNSNGQVSTLVYGWNGGAMTELWNVNMSQGTGSIAWLAGRITGGGRSRILQLWSNGGALGMILYGIPPA